MYGGFLSLIAILGLFVYFLINLRDVIDKNEEVNYSVSYIDPLTDERKFSLTSRDLNIFYKLIDYRETIPEDEDYETYVSTEFQLYSFTFENTIFI